MDERRTTTSKVSWMVGCNSWRSQLPADVVFEVLLRLPIKQLLKCMFVSKVWCSIIRQPRFVKAYLYHNPFCLVISIPEQVDVSLPSCRRIYCSNLATSGQEELFNLFNLSCLGLKLSCLGTQSSCCQVTQMINGFFCCYVGYCIILVNLFTGKVTELPFPNIPPNPRRNYYVEANADYYLGFDPVDRFYKLLCVDQCSYTLSKDSWRKGCCRAYEGTPIVEFHILTFNGTEEEEEFSWRRLRGPKGYVLGNEFCSHSISVNGALYWINNVLSNFEEFDIASFDFTTEEFMFFSVLDAGEDFLRRAFLVQFRGKVSLFACMGGDMIIHTFEIDDDGDCSARLEHKVALPGELLGDAIPVGNLSTGELLLANPDTGGSVTPVYSYDYENNRFVRFVVGKFPQSLDLELGKTNEVGSFVSCVEQKIELFEALIHRIGPRC